MVNTDKIRNILTLRYDPSGSALLPKLEWKDFVEYKDLNSHQIQILLEGATKRIIMEHQPEVVGMGISGGTDSTTTLAIARKCFPTLRIKTYCITFGNDTEEVKDAEYVASLYGTEHKHVHVENPFANLQEQVTIIDEPRWNLYPYFLFKEASRECDMLLTGDGGDELFGGYTFRYQHFLRVEQPTIQTYLDSHIRDWVPDQNKMFAFDFDWNDIYNLLSQHFENPLSRLAKVFLADYNGKLMYDFALVMARFSKHFKLKYFAPMLMPEVLYVASHLPDGLKYDLRNNVGKLVLKQILLENFGYVPATKGKVGWGMNLRDIWDSYAKEMCINHFDKPLFVEQEIINKAWLPHAFKKADDHNLRYITKMLGLLALELWLQKQR